MPATSQRLSASTVELDPARLVKISKRMSRALRHDPTRVGLTLDSGGWVDVDALLGALSITRAELDQVVAGNDKQRFAVVRDDDGVDRVRANQGHSVPVELDLMPADPPDLLFHGTGTAAWLSIQVSGIHRGGRHHVHLSPDIPTARRVGDRRGGPTVVITVDAARMARDGHVFFRSDNGVWLTDAVPAGYLHVPPAS